MCYALIMDEIKYIPGDIALVSSRGIVDLVIRLAQHRFFPPEEAQWNHAVLIADESGGIIEALANGITYSDIYKYRNKKLKYLHINYESEENRRAAVIYALHQINLGYGFREFFDLLLSAFIKLPFRIRDKNENVCSVMVALALQKGGIKLIKNPYDYCPAELDMEFTQTPVQPPK